MENSHCSLCYFIITFNRTIFWHRSDVLYMKEKMKDIQPFKILFWEHNKPKLTEKAFSGNLHITDDSLRIASESNDKIYRFSDIFACELRTLHAVGTYIHIKTKNKVLNFFILELILPIGSLLTITLRFGEFIILSGKN